MQGEVGGRGLVGMNFDDDKAGGKLEVRRADVASAVAEMGDGESGGDLGGVGCWAGLDWICLSLCSLFFFRLVQPNGLVKMGRPANSAQVGRQVKRKKDPGQALANYGPVLWAVSLALGSDLSVSGGTWAAGLAHQGSSRDQDPQRQAEVKRVINEKGLGFHRLT